LSVPDNTVAGLVERDSFSSGQVWATAMFQGWRFKLREAEEAADQGQLDEAFRMLTEGDLRQYLPGNRLSVTVAGRLAQRARRRVIQGDFAPGWRDWRNARTLAGDIEPVLEAKQEIVELGLGEAQSQLEHGHPSHAVRLLEDMERHQLDDEPLRRLKEVAQRLEAARQLGKRGHFAQAESQVRRALAIRPQLADLNRVAAEYRARVEPFRQISQAMHGALARQQWTEAVRLADQALDMAPESSLAHNARRRAWDRVGNPLNDSWAAQVTTPGNGAAKRLGGIDTEIQLAPGVIMTPRKQETRFLLWIDGVGGYLVCLGDDVLVGQSHPHHQLDVPIQADLSRRHAMISRQGDGYVIEPFHSTHVNHRAIRDRTLLTDGDEIQLGPNVRCRFRQPHALSASARLDFLSHHRTQPKSDAVLLMAESCVLGNKRRNHVTCPHWDGDVVLYRRDGELYCRAMGAIEIDGHVCEGGGRLGLNSHVSGSDFSLSLEELS
jgi:tetratricopeptide (TPR) repeat protein